MTTDKKGMSASRRQFLTGAAAVGAGTVAATVSRAAEPDRLALGLDAT